MDGAELITDGFGRIREVVHEVVEGLTEEDLTFRAGPDANTIAWLVWHLTRVQDDHVADAFGVHEVWAAKGWADRLGLPFDRAATGYRHTSQEVGEVRASAAELIGYHDDVHEQTVRLVAGVGAADLDRIVDEAWDPPVSLGVRLISVMSDDLQHAGQAAFIRGLLPR